VLEEQVARARERRLQRRLGVDRLGHGQSLPQTRDRARPRQGGLRSRVGASRGPPVGRARGLLPNLDAVPRNDVDALRARPGR
jgi:hypothetical protein